MNAHYSQVSYGESSTDVMHAVSLQLHSAIMTASTLLEQVSGTVFETTSPLTSLYSHHHLQCAKYLLPIALEGMVTARCSLLCLMRRVRRTRLVSICHL